MSDPRAVHQAAALVQAGSPAAAMQVLAPYLASEPDDPYALCLGAQSLLDLADPARSLELSRRAAFLRPDDDWAVRLQALALSELQQHAAAQAVARQSVLIGPDNWRTHYLVAFTDTRGRTVNQHSMAAAVRARELAPDEPDTHRLVGTVALRLRQRRVAVQSLEQALRLDPEDAISQHELARAHMQQFRIARSLRGFLAVGRLDPSIEQTRINLHNVMIRAVLVMHYSILVAYFLSLALPIPTAVAVAAVAIGIGLWTRLRGGPALLRFLRTLWSGDRLLVVWAGLLATAAALLVIRPLLSLGHHQTGSDAPHQGLSTLTLCLVFAGVAVSWIRRSRTRGG
jgi:tetratricopeptide (TPR) repeat protein